jgi:hypothetical protein
MCPREVRYRLEEDPSATIFKVEGYVYRVREDREGAVRRMQLRILEI